MKLFKTSLLVMLLIIVLSGCAQKIDSIEDNAKATIQIEETEDIEITDMGNRKVTIPATINKIFSVNNNGSIFIYTLAPEKLLGWNSQINEASKKYLTDEAANLPALGTLYGNSKEVNLESIIEKDPDIIIFMQSKLNEEMVEAANALQEKLSIPVVMVKGDLDSYDEAYEFMGSILHMEEEAGALSIYCKKNYEKAEILKAGMEKEEMVRVYYARGDDGLTTEVSGSTHAKLLEIVGAYNVIEKDSVTSNNPVVSIEQVIEVNPEVILIGSNGFAKSGALDSVTDHVGWETLDAVKNGRVYIIPQLPFNWFDRPPSVNRAVGINWLIWKLYPDNYEGDIEVDIKEFFKLFYHVSITSEDVEKFLN